MRQAIELAPMELRYAAEKSYLNLKAAGGVCVFQG
jgi:hypothetical protein